MSDLREQLDAAKQAYQSAGYPGDLVTDLRKRNRGQRPVRWILPLGTAIAAAVAVVIWLRPAEPITNPPPAETPIAAADVELVIPAHVPMPADVAPSVPSATLSVPSMPSIPTWSVSTDVSLDESTSG